MCALSDGGEMVVIARPVVFDDDDPRPMFRHLDGWARASLNSPEGWASTLERCGQWADYSARNQVLLASYGIVGPVAGTATWERVPSVEPGRMCAVRAGEHGLLVRVPVIEVAEVTSDRSRLGGVSGSTVGSTVGSHRWEPVFASEQLARRPAVGALLPTVVPVLRPGEWSEVVRAAAGRMTGRTPRKVDDPSSTLAELAGRVPNGPGRVRLDGQMCAQAGWLAAARVGLAAGPMPGFDPESLSSRERWRTLADVRHATGQVLTAVSHALEVDLCGSMLPRHEAVDDRTVPAGRRNYLAPSDVRSLPRGVWVEAGPYTKSEWLARGVAGAAGTAAFLRVNDRSYLAAYETRTGALWRLETTGRGAHHGLVAEGTTDTLQSAKDCARQAMADRFPDVARAVDASVGSPVVAPHAGWVQQAGSRDGRTEQRTFDDRVAAMVSPGPGGRWQTWTIVDGRNQQGPLAATAADARQVADGLAHGVLMQHGTVAPDRANALVRNLAGSGDGWSRADLVTVIGHRLTDVDRVSLTETASAEVLAGHLVDSGVLAPSTMMAVLHAEAFELDSVVAVIPIIGLSVPDAIRELHDSWDANRLQAGAALGASTEELRAAGCTPTEMLAAAPREELRRLDTREQTWQLAGAALLDAGYTRSEAVGHLAAHAPTPASFAAGVSTIVDDPVEAFIYSARRAATEDLVALSERYDLSPEQTARALTLSCTPRGVAVDVIAERCDNDSDTTIELATEYLGIGADVVHQMLTEPDTSRPGSAIGLDPANVESLLAAIGPAIPNQRGLDSDSLLAALTTVAAAPELTVEMS